MRMHKLTIIFCGILLGCTVQASDSSFSDSPKYLNYEKLILGHPIILAHPEYGSYPEQLPLKFKTALQIMAEIINGTRPDTDLQKLPKDIQDFITMHVAYQHWHKRTYGNYSIPNYASLPEVASLPIYASFPEDLPINE